MALPNVIINQSNGNLGIVAQDQDSISGIIVSGVAVSGQFALGDLIGPITSLAEAEAKGITEAYDATNTCQAWKQISDFYSEAPKGTKLWVMVLAKTVTLAQMCDNANAYVKKMIDDAVGDRPRTVIVTRTPDGAYTPTYATQLDNDVITAVANAKALIAAKQAEYKYPRIIIECRDWQGTVASTLDLRNSATSPNANRVALVIGQDTAYANALPLNDKRKKYAFAGLVGGRLAAIPVQRNIARTADGPLAITTPGFSNNALNTTLTPSNLDTMNDKGYIFLRGYEGQAGYYFNMDHTATVSTDDFNNLRYGRVIDKASLLAYATYIQRLNDEILIDEVTGKMQPSVIKSLEGEIEKQIQLNMVDEISAADAFIDADQNVLSTNNINVELSITPKGNASTFTVTLGLVNPFLNA